MRKRLASLALLFAMTTAPAASQTPPPVDDPYVWLEDWTGARSMQWVEAENARTLDRLKNDPRYRGYYADALAIAAAKDRIPYPNPLGGWIFNFWRDADHPQGIWRYTNEADYASASPKWTTVLDLDALSKAEGKKWVWKGATCFDPDERLCLVNLSDGGEDAVTLREFDLQAGKFVNGGFELAKSKQDVAWADKDTIFISRDWGANTMTASGYPFVVKSLKRGQPVDSAAEIFRGAATDQVGSAPFTLRDGSGNRASFIYRGTTFFENETYLVTPEGTKRVPIPGKATLSGMVQGNVIVTTSEDWTAGGVTIPAGGVATVTLSDLRDGGALSPKLLFAPNSRQSVAGVFPTKSHLIVTITDNVRGRAFVMTPGAKAWSTTPLKLQDNATINVVATSDKSDKAYADVTGFLDPTTLWSVDAVNGKTAKVKSLPARFDGSNLVVEQFEATSTDGTKIPYFIVHKKGIVLDGSTPTIMTAYGGFELSRTPAYSGILGKLWMEKGGSFVLANIRGGGEFGPAWHEAGRKTKRQIIYDDFASVAKDVFGRKLSRPAKFGIYGGSNGGLLMGVEFNQHPDLWKAVVIQVPLLDMIRYEQIAAGASWVDEYGSVSVPEEKAFLEKISPYSNIRKGGAYPEPYIWTTTKDDRVGPQHARKFAARLKEYNLPYLFYEDTAGGHSGDADIEQQARLQAMQMTYFAQKLLGPAE